MSQMSEIISVGDIVTPAWFDEKLQFESAKVLAIAPGPRSIKSYSRYPEWTSESTDILRIQIAGCPFDGYPTNQFSPVFRVKAGLVQRVK